MLQALKMVIEEQIWLTGKSTAILAWAKQFFCLLVCGSGLGKLLVPGALGGLAGLLVEINQHVNFLRNMAPTRYWLARSGRGYGAVE